MAGSFRKKISTAYCYRNVNERLAVVRIRIASPTPDEGERSLRAKVSRVPNNSKLTGHKSPRLNDTERTGEVCADGGGGLGGRRGGRGRRAKSRLVKEDEIGRSGSGKTKDIERGTKGREKKQAARKDANRAQQRRKEGRRGRREEEEGRKEGKKRETIEVGMPNNGE